MALYVRNRSGSLQRVGLQKRSGGGYSRGTGSGGLSTQRGSINIQTQVQQRQEAQNTPVVAVEPTPTQSTPSTYFTSPILNRPVSQDELTQWQKPTVIAGTTYRRTVGGEIQPQTTEQKLVSTIDKNKVNPSTFGAARSFGAGFVMSGIETFGAAKRIVKSPIKTAASAAFAVQKFDMLPAKQKLSTVKGFASGVYDKAAASPSSFFGGLAFDFAAGKGIEKGFKATSNVVKFSGKPGVAATEIVAPSYLSGTEYYPTGSPGEAVRAVNFGKRAFSASPAAPNKGGSFTVLTQAEKKAKGLDLSETGGLYAAPKVSPAFTTVVAKTDGYNGFTLIPRWGMPGAISEIKTGAIRLPGSVRAQMVRENSIRAGNAFLDEGGLKGGTNKAFSTPATELGIKTESEVLIPGRSTLQRTKQYGFVDRALGRDFEYFVDIPKTPGGTKTTRVAVRQYENIGFKGDTRYSRGRALEKKGFRASDIDYYSSGRSASSGFLKFLPTSSSASRSSSYSGSYGSLPGFSSSKSSPSSSKKSYSSSSYPVESSGLFSGSSSYRSYSRSSALSSSKSSSSYSSSYSSYTPPLLGKGLFNFEGDERMKRKKGKSFKQKKQISIYDSSLTARSFGIKASSKRATGYTGLEIRGI